MTYEADEKNWWIIKLKHFFTNLFKFRQPLPTSFERQRIIRPNKDCNFAIFLVH